MASRPKKSIAPTKKHLARKEREDRASRNLLIGSLILLAAVVALVGYGVLDQMVFQKIRPVAVVNGEKIQANHFEDYTRYNRYTLVRNAMNTYDMVQMFGGDPNMAASFVSQLQQIQSQLSLDAAKVVGEQSLDQMIEHTLIRQEAEALGITVTEEEIDEALKAAFRFYPDGTATPTATVEVIPTSTLSSQQLTMIPPTPTATITPTLTATATLAEGETPEPTLEPTATFTPLPTVDFTPTPDASPTPQPTATEYTEEGFQTLYAEQMQQFEEVYGISEKTIYYVVEQQIYRDKMMEAVIGEFTCTDEQVWAMHILVQDEAAAQEVLDRLEAGEDWAALASTYSIDTSNKDQGGDLGWFGRNMMVPEFEEAAFATGIGETSGLVQTQFGFHIIRVLGHEERPVEPQTCESLRQQKFQEWLDGVREAAEIEYKDYWGEHVPTEPVLPPELEQFIQQAAAQQQQMQLPATP